MQKFKKGKKKRKKIPQRLQSIISYRDLSSSRKAVSCIRDVSLALPCRIEINYLEAMM